VNPFASSVTRHSSAAAAACSSAVRPSKEFRRDDVIGSVFAPQFEPGRDPVGGAREIAPAAAVQRPERDNVLALWGARLGTAM